MPRPLLFRLTTVLATTVSLATAGDVSAQELTILNPEYTQIITQEVSGDAAYAHVRFMTQFHRPRGGSDGLWRVAEYIDAKAREYGMRDVRLIKQASTTRPWNATFADLWIVEPEPERLASTIQSVLHLADYSRSADVTAELIDIGAGGDDDYDDRDVTGKVVLTYGPLSGAMREAVWNRGALGVVWYPSPFTPDLGTSGAGISRPDQLRWISLPSRGSDDHEPTFAFGLSLRQGVALANKLAQSETPVRVQAVVDAAFDSEQGEEPWQVMVEAFIRGSDPGLAQDIVLTGHLQEEGTSANDDASGSASTLEVARALNRLIADGRLPRPKRNIRFWWVTEISSQRQYFADNPTAHEAMWVNVNQDMVGANQAQDVMRKQNVTRVPAARFHFFNDIVESVVEYMVAANNFELAQMQSGALLYPKPHLAHLGTQHRYNADVIYFHTSSDHMTFLETPIGMPATSFTNMPDRFIHSSDDDLWNIDATQLGRNGAAVALIAYTMANAGASDLSAFAAATVGRGVERLGENLGRALSWIAAAEDKVAAYHQAADQVWYAAERERMALASLTEIDAGAASDVDQLLAELKRREVQAMRDLELAFRQTSGKRRLPRRTYTTVEQQLAELRPVVTGGPTKFLTGRRQIGGVRGLHSLMAFEVLNAVDGKRNGLDIYRFVSSEAREAGDFYFGRVEPEGVMQLLERVEDAGLMDLRRGATEGS